MRCLSEVIRMEVSPARGDNADEASSRSPSRWRSPREPRRHKPARSSGRSLKPGARLPYRRSRFRSSEVREVSSSGPEGKFRLVNVPSGPTQLRVTRIGYAAATQTVNVPTGNVATADFALTVSQVLLDQVVVTGTQAGERERETGNLVRHRHRFDQQGARRDVLRPSGREGGRRQYRSAVRRSRIELTHPDPREQQHFAAQ